MSKIWARFAFGVLAISTIFCGQAAPQPEGTEPPPPTATSVPTPLPPVSIPDDLPEESDLQELVLYAHALNPLLVKAGEVI